MNFMPTVWLWVAPMKEHQARVNLHPMPMRTICGIWMATRFVQCVLPSQNKTEELKSSGLTEFYPAPENCKGRDSGQRLQNSRVRLPAIDFGQNRGKWYLPQ